MKRNLIPALLLILCLCSCGANPSGLSTPETAENSAEPVAVSGTYDIYVTGYDWGSAVDKAVIHFDGVLDSVGKDDFIVIQLKSKRQ